VNRSGTSSPDGQAGNGTPPYPVGDMFVVIEFTGIARQYDIPGILRKITPETTVLEIDPLDIPDSCRWDNQERAREICRTITAAAPSRVALIAYCTGAFLASQVASALASAGVCVTGYAVLDPTAVTSSVIYDALGEIMEALGRSISPHDYEKLHLYNPELCDTSRVEDILLSWIRDCAPDALALSAYDDPLINELAERYINWISFLCATAWEKDELSGPLSIFTSEDGLEHAEYLRGLPRGVLNSYATQGASCLAAHHCVLDFGNWCKSVIAKW
jgi:hypothetical protein